MVIVRYRCDDGVGVVDVGRGVGVGVVGWGVGVAPTGTIKCWPAKISHGFGIPLEAASCCVVVQKRLAIENRVSPRTTVYVVPLTGPIACGIGPELHPPGPGDAVGPGVGPPHWLGTMITVPDRRTFGFGPMTPRLRA